MTELIKQSYNAIILGSYKSEFERLMYEWGNIERSTSTEYSRKICGYISRLFMQIQTHAWKDGKRYEPLSFPTETPPKILWLYRFENYILELGCELMDLKEYPVGNYSHKELKRILE